ncbi:hypothetical protein [Longirhabdus pacifica]|uniref:hypothetical protein n=1 Tax=Longirhabdus pacifica TaxID=2305227 RepID=UPI0010087CB1|nr:hypothetical protein [Longirhabdus pacifica]
MPDITPKLGIKKPLGNEYVSRQSFNDNWDTVDERVASQVELNEHKADSTSHITETERENWNSAEVNAKAYVDQMQYMNHFQRDCLVLGNNDWTPFVYNADRSNIAYDPELKGVLVTGHNACIIQMRIPIDPESTYYGRVKIKKISGDGTFYCGAHSLNHKFENLYTDEAHSYNYFVSGVTTIPVGETRVLEGTISGYNAEDEASPHKFDPYAAYFDMVIVCNHYGEGQTLIESLEVYKVPHTLYVGNHGLNTMSEKLFIGNNGKGEYGIKLNNSDIIGANSIVFRDIANAGDEGLLFPKEGKESSTNLEDYYNFRIDKDGNGLLNGSKIFTEEKIKIEDGELKFYTGTGWKRISGY